MLQMIQNAKQVSHFELEKERNSRLESLLDPLLDPSIQRHRAAYAASFAAYCLSRIDNRIAASVSIDVEIPGKWRLEGSEQVGWNLAVASACLAMIRLEKKEVFEFRKIDKAVSESGGQLNEKTSARLLDPIRKATKMINKRLADANLPVLASAEIAELARWIDLEFWYPFELAKQLLQSPGHRFVITNGSVRMEAITVLTKEALRCSA